MLKRPMKAATDETNGQGSSISDFADRDRQYRPRGTLIWSSKRARPLLINSSAVIVTL